MSASGRLRAAVLAGVLSVAGGLAALAAAADRPPQREPAVPEPAGFVLGGDAARGRPLFVKRCALCHGERGDGKGPQAGKLDPPPRDLTDPALQAGLSDWEVYLVIRDGGQALGLSKTMFAWGKLMPDRELRDVAAYVRSLPAGRAAR